MEMVKFKTNGPRVTLVLEDANGVKPMKSFYLVPQKITTIPLDYAASIFNYNSTQELYRTSVISPVDEAGRKALEAEAQKAGYLPEEEKVQTVNHDQIKAILKSNNLTAIKELFTGSNQELAMDLANEIKEEIPSGVLDKIAALTDIDLRID